jgi:hypothetical protein
MKSSKLYHKLESLELWACILSLDEQYGSKIRILEDTSAVRRGGRGEKWWCYNVFSFSCTVGYVRYCRLNYD